MPRKLSLSNQFLIAAALVLCVFMAVLGSWVNNRITRSVLTTTGADSRAMIQGLIGPLIQNVLPDGTLPQSSHQALDALFVNTPIGRNIVSVKIWRKDQTVIYSSMSKDVIGKSFVSTDVEKAFAGQIVSEFEDMVSSESAYEQSLSMPLIEVYAPLYRNGTRDIIAVGEVYDDARDLAAELRASMWRTWLVVSITTLMMLAILYGIVRRGSHTIEAQRSELDKRVFEAQSMAAQNAELRTIAERTRLDANEANEELLGRIGQDLHDGPIQLSSLLMLRVSELSKNAAEAPKEAAAAIRSLAEEITSELRMLSIGLVLPELRNLSLGEAIELAIYRHENLTGTSVEASIGTMPEVNDALKICLYRIVQESLTNSFRHAGGKGQFVGVAHVGDVVELTVSDKGTGFQEPAAANMKHEKLGLRGIHNRAQAFGGHVVILSDQENGTEVSVSIPLGRPR